MSNYANKTAKQKRESRLLIVAELHKKGYSFRQIKDEVMKREGLKTYSLDTVKKDVDTLLSEWRSQRISDMDLGIQLELARIDNQMIELWEAWEKSKTDQKTKSLKQRGAASTSGLVVDKAGGLGSDNKIVTTNIEKTEKEEINYGDPRYQDLINKLSIERRKLLGYYPAEKKDITTNGESIGFYSLLQSINIIDGDEETENEDVK